MQSEKESDPAKSSRQIRRTIQSLSRNYAVVFSHGTWYDEGEKYDQKRKDYKVSTNNAIHENNENFIMLPKVDFCFKELMNNEKVRMGFIAAVLGKDPAEIRRTTLIPTELRRESPDDKLGILDVMVELENGAKLNMEMQVPHFEFWPNRVLFYECKVYTGQIKKGESYEAIKPCIHVSILDFIHFPQDDRCYRKIAFCDVETGKQYTDLMELHILELRKLPAEDQNEEGVIHWMRFLSGKTRKEFEDMAKKDEYIEEAYNELKKLSLDEKKRLEYEARERALHDYNTQMQSAERRGEHATLMRLAVSMKEKGKTPEEIAELLDLDTDKVAGLLKEYRDSGYMNK